MEGHSFRLSVLRYVRPFYSPIVVHVCTLCAQLLLQFYSNSLETLQWLDHALKVCISLDIFLRLIFDSFFRNLNLARVGNESESFCAQILLQFYSEPVETLQMHML